MVKGRVARLAAVAGVSAIALMSFGGAAGAQSGVSWGGNSVQPGQYSDMDPTPHAAAALSLAHYYNDSSYDAAAFEIAAQLADDQANGRALNPDADRRTIAIAKEIHAKYATQLVIDTMGGEANFNLAKQVAAFAAPEGCSDDYDFMKEIALKTQLIDTNTRDGQASVTLHLDRPLCTPTTFELQSWSKIGSKPWPSPQVVHDVDSQLVHEAGVYTFEVAAPGGILGLVCAAQLDFARTSGGFGPEGPITPALLDFAQYDDSTPNDPAYSSWNYFPADICDDTPQTGGETAEPDNTVPVQVAGQQTSKPVSGSLANTGASTVPMLLVGAVFLIGGWLCLAGKAAIGALAKK